ncbi:UNVERIFIED_CONTAM: hypothetical protein FKN15_063775 [Acipenser sinensis]
MENQQILLPDGHVLGDSAYPLETYLLTPYRNNGHLTRKQSRYNYLHRCAHSVIERCFTQLKGQFCHLKYQGHVQNRHDTKSYHCCCVLHNIIIEREGNSHVAQDEAGDEDSLNFGNANHTTAAVKRYNIAELL